MNMDNIVMIRMAMLKLKYVKFEAARNKAQVDKYSFKLCQTLKN